MEMRYKIIILIIILSGFLSIPYAGAQNSQVCLVYFTRSDCDDCGMIDTHLDGLINEYSNILTVIKYNIEISQENMDVFGAYRNRYGLPSETPMVLFGADNYLVGMDDIYAESEIRIIDFIVKNGTNCPLESGYVAPSQLNPVNIPGEFEIFESTGVEETEGDPGEGGNQSDRETGEEEGDQDGTPDMVSMIRESLESADLPLMVMILIIIILIIGIVIAAKKG